MTITVAVLLFAIVVTQTLTILRLHRIEGWLAKTQRQEVTTPPTQPTMQLVLRSPGGDREINLHHLATPPKSYAYGGTLYTYHERNADGQHCYTAG